VSSFYPCDSTLDHYNLDSPPSRQYKRHLCPQLDHFHSPIWAVALGSNQYGKSLYNRLVINRLVINVTTEGTQAK